ncbi:DUF4157 domain-containing protein [Micromonospora sp. WMMD1102]|uniref:eCIS core domain-containing protein n=1 Tax=Micromonospora sp. WMMD1102 TaxID=3016105 RepID=UPI0024153C58|nr:DUF4157 domain-containing protein [Micromonospora sp. WMMD1102]MDG4786283.1 DUF4157 domain-containing protein [Micromonospora sp. WMMD1102]
MRAHDPPDRDLPGRPDRPARPARPGTGSTAPTGSVAAILALQRQAGNAAVTRAIQRLRDGLDTAREQADEHGDGQRPAPEPVQRSAVSEVLRSAGQPLDGPTRTDMEARLGADFSDVRLHTGALARRSAAEVGARAYTSGRHVVIGQGGADRHTLAHELTHVIQQRSGPVAGTDDGHGLRVSDPGDAFERAAEANATRALAAPRPAGGPGVAGGGTDADRGAVQRMVAGDDEVEVGPSGKRERSESPEEAHKRARPGGESESESESEPDEAEVTPELFAWMRSPTTNRSEYADPDPTFVREIAKTDKGAACWSWALAAMEQDGKPSYGDFWDVLHGVTDVDTSPPAWFGALEAAVQEQIRGLTQRLAEDDLLRGIPPPPDLTVGEDDDKIEKAGQFLQAACEKYVEVHGMRVVPDSEAAAWVVCQYKFVEGTAGPEHWWIELGRGRKVVLQTVPGKNLEVGGVDLRWHHQSSAQGRSSGKADYGLIRVPVRALKGRHVEILKAGMAQERAALNTEPTRRRAERTLTIRTRNTTGS